MKDQHGTFHANRAKNGRLVKPAFSLWDFAAHNSEQHASKLRQIENAAIDNARETLKQT